MSKETKFTKGDWFVGFNKTSVYTGNKASGEGNIVSKCGEFTFIDRSVEESIANAHLISASPEMYDLLMTIENDSDQVPAWLWNKIQLTLKKARGE